MCSCTTRSLPGSRRHAMPGGSKRGVMPGVQPSAWLSGLCAPGEHPIVPRPRVGIVEQPRGARPIDPDGRVVNDVRISRTHFDSAHERRGRQRKRKHEVAELVSGAGIEGIRLPELDDEVRFAELPVVSPRRGLPLVAAVTFRRAGIGPCGDALNVCVREHARVGKRSVSARGQPRRHRAIGGRPDDLCRVLNDVAVGDERKGRHLPLPMAWCAVLPHQGSDVGIEGGRGTPRLATASTLDGCDREERKDASLPHTNPS